MDEAKFQDFAGKLRTRSVKQIRELARSESIELDVGITDKELLLRTLFAALPGSGAPAAPAPEPKVDTPPAVSGVLSSASPGAVPASEPKRTVRAFAAHYRCKRRWTPVREEVLESEFTPEEWKLLEADKQLQIKRVS